MKNTPNPLRVLALLAAGLVCAYHAHAQNIWVGISGVSATTNWSDALNWSMGTAPAGEGVLFQNDGAVAVGVVNNVVDGAFAGSAGTLQYGNTNGSHTTLIPAGVTLTVGGTLTAGTETDNSNTQQTTNTITGAGTLNQTAGDLIVRQTTGGGNSSLRATLNMSGLNTYTANIGMLRVGKQLAS